MRTGAAWLAAALALALLACQARPAAEAAGASPPAASGAPAAEPPGSVPPEPRASAEAVAPRPPVTRPATPPAPFSDRLLAERPFGARLPKDFAIGGLAAAADRNGALQAARTFLGALASNRAEGFAVDAAWEETFRLLYATRIRDLPPGLGFRLADGVEGPDGAETFAFALIGPAGRSDGSARFYREGEAWSLAGLEVDLSPEAFARTGDGAPFDPERYDWPD